MLTIGKLGRGQESYYLEKVAQGTEDYYSGEGEASGRWIGDAADELGLQGTVGADQLTAMLTGRNPLDGEPLVGMRGVPSAGAVPGFDLTFSAPKSVSLLWAVGGPLAAVEVTQAHERAVSAALACAGGAEFVHGNGFLAAAFRHRSSRAGDPQLHTHVLIANATKGPDGRWTRLYHPAIYDHAKTADYIYEAQLRHELSRSLGVEWQEVCRGIAEIEGFADHHLREFSTRRAEILQAAGGPDASARARQIATFATRGAKEQGVSREDLLERWRSKAQEIGLHHETIESTLHPDHPAVAPTVLTVEQLDRAVTAGASHFDRRDAIQAVADSLPHGAEGIEVEQIADAFLASDSAIRIGESPKGERFTTRRIWELEQTALASAERMRLTDDRAQVNELAVERVLSSHPTLKDDQREMVRALLGGGEGLAIVVGEAGTGKTHATIAAAQGWAAAGIELRAAAPTWRAANVLRSEGLAATSIASLLGELDDAAQRGLITLRRNSVLLIDEAGMVDSATLARLISHADQAKAKLVLIGDQEQLGEIEAGGLFRALADRSDPIRLAEVIRHHHELDRDAAKRIREGHGAEALDLYRSEERVVVAPDAEARREAMVGDWWESFSRGEDALMVAKRNAEVQRLNEMARQVMREAGWLGEAEIEVGEARFAAGDQVITRVNDRSAEIYNRERWQVAEVDPEHRRVVLDGIDQARRVVVEAEYLVRTNPRDDAPALQHAYATTTYCAQGTTVDCAFVTADPSMDKQELYVAASRSREETYLYATPEIQVDREEYAPRSPYLREGLEHIAEAAERDRAQIAAHDEALRSSLRKLPTDQLQARGKELRRELGEAQRHQRAIEAARDRLAHGRRSLAGAEQRVGWAEEAGRSRRKQLPGLRQGEQRSREALARSERALAEVQAVRVPLAPPVAAELAVVDRVLAERCELAITAARIAPPEYIVKELGERSSDPAKRRSWEQGVEEIERYRQEHGVKDRHSALGAEPTRSSERIDWQAQRRRLAERQLALGLEQGLAHARELGRGMELGM